MHVVQLKRTLWVKPRGCFLTAALSLLFIVGTMVFHHDRLSPTINELAAAAVERYNNARVEHANNNNNAVDSNANEQQKQQQNIVKQEDEEEELNQNAEDWVDRQEKELAELLSLGQQCQSGLPLPPMVVEKDDGVGGGGAVKRLPMNDWNAMCRGLSIERDFDNLMRPHCRSRYLMVDYTYCSGLGNQMFRFASLYGIGKASCRRPLFVKGVQECALGKRQKEKWRYHDRESADEMERVFPLYSTQLKYVNLSEIKPSDIRRVEGFATNCCKYDDPARLQLHAMQEKYVQFQKVDYLQNYKFFGGRRKDMRQIFQFSPKTCKSVLNDKCKLFENDRSSHKLCVHNRLSDFVQFGWQSDLSFTVNAIQYIHDDLKAKAKVSSFSVILLGTEKDFLDKIEHNLNKTLYTKLYIPETKTRGEDLAFATIACDSLLITAPASTFSWWMAYLMPDGAPIYYSAPVEKTPHKKDNFLKEWTPLRLVNNTNIIRDND